MAPRQISSRSTLCRVCHLAYSSSFTFFCVWFISFCICFGKPVGQLFSKDNNLDVDTGFYWNEVAKAVCAGCTNKYFLIIICYGGNRNGVEEWCYLLSCGGAGCCAAAARRRGGGATARRGYSRLRRDGLGLGRAARRRRGGHYVNAKSGGQRFSCAQPPGLVRTHSRIDTLTHETCCFRF